MTKKELRDIYFIKREINEIKRQIEDTECYTYTTDNYTSDSVKGSLPEHPYTQHSIKIRGYEIAGTEQYYKKLNRLHRRLRERSEDLLDIVAKANDFIASIESAELRLIVSLRYINGMTWEQIGAEIGYSWETVRKKHDNFIKYTN